MNTENRNTETELTNTGASAANASIQTQPKASRRSRYTVIVSVLVVLAVGLVLGVVPRLHAKSKLAAAVEAIPHQTVTVTNVNRQAGNVQLALPCDVNAF